MKELSTSIREKNRQAKQSKGQNVRELKIQAINRELIIQQAEARNLEGSGLPFMGKVISIVGLLRQKDDLLPIA